MKKKRGSQRSVRKQKVKKKISVNRVKSVKKNNKNYSILVFASSFLVTLILLSICFPITGNATFSFFKFKKSNLVIQPNIISCTDGIKNGAESDIDCGGSVCNAQGRKCLVGESCNGLAINCQSENCLDGICKDSTRCSGTDCAIKTEEVSNSGITTFPPTCSDSDKGDIPNIAGTTEITYRNGMGTRFNDYCTGLTLSEYWCANRFSSTPSITLHDCSLEQKTCKTNSAGKGYCG